MRSSSDGRSCGSLNPSTILPYRRRLAQVVVLAMPLAAASVAAAHPSPCLLHPDKQGLRKIGIIAEGYVEGEGFKYFPAKRERCYPADRRKEAPGHETKAGYGYRHVHCIVRAGDNSVYRFRVTFHAVGNKKCAVHITVRRIS